MRMKQVETNRDQTQDEAWKITTEYMGMLTLIMQVQQWQGIHAVEVEMKKKRAQVKRKK